MPLIKTDTSNGKQLSQADARGYRAGMSWDGFDRGGLGTKSSGDSVLIRQRIELTFLDNQTFTWAYSSGGQFDRVLLPGAAPVVDYNYNSRNELESAVRYRAASDQGCSYDPLGRLAGISLGTGEVDVVTWAFTRNPASQILTETQSNDGYS